MTTQNVLKKIPHAFSYNENKQFWLNIYELYQKVSDGNLLFWFSMYNISEITKAHPSNMVACLMWEGIYRVAPKKTDSQSGPNLTKFTDIMG